jgi:hypothetical protein
LKDEVEGFCRVAVVKLEEVGEGLALLEGNDGKEGIAGECQIESGPGSSMPVPVFLPGGGVAFVVVAIFDTPVPASGAGGTGFFFRPQAGEEDASMALGRLRFFLFAPVALHGHCGAGTGQSGRDRGDGFYGGFAGVDAPVISFATQVKKGEPSRAREAPSSRLEVFSLVPMR